MRWTVFFLSIGVIISGCGSDETVAPPARKTPTAAPPSPPPVAAAPTRAATPARPAPAKTTPAKGPKVDESEPITHNHFVHQAAPVRFDVASASEAPQENQYSVIRPKYDSRRMIIELPEEETAFNSRLTPQMALPKGFLWLPEFGLNAQGLPQRIVCEADGAEMQLIESGVFVQGTDRAETGASPQVNVYVSPFYIDVTETTFAQYDRFLKTEPSAAKPVLPQGLDQKTAADYPVLGLPFNDVLNYAKWAGKDLPTESEWERAARGPNGSLYPWGNSDPPRVDGDLSQILPVGSRPTDLTRTGIYDLSGNAREWVHDWYSSQAYQELATKSGTPMRDPQGPKLAEILGERVVRGSRDDWELWIRGHANIKRSAPDVGFRCVLRVTEEMLPENSGATASR
ncbi:SUMF1/EgtB/PvdO family nonheme iron enzyme [Thalassoglobus sp. JC818]|uniref:formylglycine-generating enzyme family protein n=1 Tax=Thalassoglobus sp. JC818 TaxID=3232136 RepID=UPI003459F9A7